MPKKNGPQRPSSMGITAYVRLDWREAVVLLILICELIQGVR